MPTDTLGVTIEVGDTVTVTSWGAPVRLVDTGRRALVVGFTRSGNVHLLAEYSDAIANGRAVSPGMLAVARRDGQPGHEGNAPRCTCGATAFRDCYCPGVGAAAFEAAFCRTCGDRLDAPTGAGSRAACASTHKAA